MKVYRIKHKPSGLFLEIGKNRLSTKGSVIDWKPMMTMERPICHVFCGVEEFLWTTNKIWELKEYELKD